MDNRLAEFSQKKLFYPSIFFIFLLISFLPLITQKSYSPENTQQVIIELLKVSIKPYQALGVLFHVVTIFFAGLVLINSKTSGRLMFAYMGVNFIVIALVQSFGITDMYGEVIHTGGFVSFSLLGILWIWAAVKSDAKPLIIKFKWQHILLIPFAVLAFWSPYQVQADVVLPDFNPVLLLTSPDYGLTFCFTTPVFLFLLFVIFPKVNIPVYRITAFNGLLYAIFNLAHWFNPATRWMGFLHLPLLVLSIAALIQSRKRDVSQQKN